MLSLPCTLPHILSILISILHSPMPAEAVPPTSSPTSSSSHDDMAVVQAQAKALIAFKDAITNDPSSCLSSSWTTNSNSTTMAPPSYCSANGTAGWYGLHCDDRFHITSFNLSSCNLSGSISHSLALLPSLSLLDLSDNNFSGPLLFFTRPNSSLTYLDLSENSLLSGPIPRSLILNSPNLQNLSLEFTGLSGLVPPEIWTHLPALQELSIFDDSSPPLLSISPTSFPPTANFAFCATIQMFVLFGIDASGVSFPSSLGDCQQLQILFLLSTGLQGSIPPSIWQLPHLQLLLIEDLNVVDAMENNPDQPRPYKLHGSLPSTFGFCSLTAGSTIELMYIVGINLTGHIPASIGTCASLQYLKLSYTNLQGIVPVDALHNLGALQILRLSQNNLTGKIESLDLSKLPNLGTFNVYGNALEGGLPAGLTESKALLIFNVQGNKYLTGSLGNTTTTPHITGLSKLRVLCVSYNQLSGDIPGWVWKLPSLQALDLSNNHFSGRFPATLTHLSYFKLNQTVISNQTSLYEELPVTIQNTVHILHYVLSARIYIDVSMNDLEGEIPESFGDLQGLAEANLSHNRINGSIPAATFGRLMQLDVLDLSYNQLSGGIPQDLTSLGSLGTLNLTYNQLEGAIPTQNNFNTRFTNESFKNNPGLCGYPLSSSCNTINNNVTTTTTSHVGSTSRAMQLMVIWLDEVVSPWALLMGYPLGLALGFLVCRTLSIKGIK